MDDEVHTDRELRAHLPISKSVNGRPIASAKNIFDHEWKGFATVTLCS